MDDNVKDDTLSQKCGVLMLANFMRVDYADYWQ